MRRATQQEQQAVYVLLAENVEVVSDGIARYKTGHKSHQAFIKEVVCPYLGIEWDDRYRPLKTRLEYAFRELYGKLSEPEEPAVIEEKRLAEMHDAIEDTAEGLLQLKAKVLVLEGMVSKIAGGERVDVAARRALLQLYPQMIGHEAREPVTIVFAGEGAE